MKPYVLLITFGLSCFMTGLIWIVQLVHYPFFQYVDQVAFESAHSYHVVHIGWIVLPIMCLELYFSVWSAYIIWDRLGWLQLALLIAIWLITAVYLVPDHDAMKAGYSTVLIDDMVLHNWPRTILWSLRSVILFIVLMPILRAINPAA